MFNTTNWLLAQMLMAPSRSPTADGQFPRATGQSTAQQANVNIQQVPVAPIPAPSWEDTQTRYLMHHLLFNPSPLGTQGRTYRHLNREEKADPAPNPELFDSTPLSNQHFAWPRR